MIETWEKIGSLREINKRIKEIERFGRIASRDQLGELARLYKDRGELLIEISGLKAEASERGRA